jgi:iron complex transport system substrate-binding protein
VKFVASFRGDEQSQETCLNAQQLLNAREKVFRPQWEFSFDRSRRQPVAFARQKVTGFLIFKQQIWSAPAKQSGDGDLFQVSLSLWERVRVRVLADRLNPSPRPSPSGRGRRTSRAALATALQIFVIGIATLFMFACSNGSNEKATSQAATREVTDEAGRRVVLPVKIDRIVSLAPNLTEIVYAIGAGDRLVGDTTYCDFPEAAKNVAKVGDTMNPSIERIIALKPQVVLISTASQLEAFTNQLGAQQIAVYVTNPQSLDDIFRSIQTLGDLFEEHEHSAGLVAALQKRASSIEAVTNTGKQVKVFYQVSGEPLYTIGREAFLTDLIKRAGGISVTADVPGAFPRFSDEAALAAKPDAIILPTGGSMGEGNSTVVTALKNSPAVLNGRIYKINGDLLSRPGPRLVDGLEEMARALHPEAFK